MKKIKYIIILLLLFLVTTFIFIPETFPVDYNFYNSLNLAGQSDIIIIFNSGGWGNIPLEKAEDFYPIIKGIRDDLNDLGYNSMVIPYTRTKEGFFEKIKGTRELFSSFSGQAEELSTSIDNFLKKSPNKKIIIAGLSNGAVFVDETMEKISKNIKNQVYAIEIGIPFWRKTLDSSNILRLNNEGKDPLSMGDMKILISGFFRASFKWFFAKASGEDLTFSKALFLSGHQYSWNGVEPEISSFLQKKLK